VLQARALWALRAATSRACGELAFLAAAAALAPPFGSSTSLS
jgi:hypothetical protein